MHYESFDIFIQCCFSKVFFINKFYLFSDEQSLGGSIRPLDKLFFCKLDVCIVESKEKYF